MARNTGYFHLIFDRTKSLLNDVSVATGVCSTLSVDELAGNISSMDHEHLMSEKAFSSCH